ncbi:unnamed protein product [Heterobilharzia americana]|nr:unnamed protein product [Heterobilharzia americana]
MRVVVFVVSFSVGLLVTLAEPAKEEPENVKAAVFKVHDCLVLSAIMKIHLSDMNSTGDLESVFTTYINSTNANTIKSDGSCSEDFNRLYLNWLPNGSDGNWSMSFTFSHPQPNYYGLSDIHLSYKLNKPNVSDASIDKLIFSCAVGSSFMCISEQTYELKDKSSNSTNIRFTFSQFQVEAFRTNNSATEFTGPRKLSIYLRGILVALCLFPVNEN